MAHNRRGLLADKNYPGRNEGGRSRRFGADCAKQLDVWATGDCAHVARPPSPTEYISLPRTLSGIAAKTPKMNGKLAGETRPKFGGAWPVRDPRTLPLPLQTLPFSTKFVTSSSTALAWDVTLSEFSRSKAPSGILCGHPLR